MIGRLAGTLLEKQPPELLVDVNGVGYELHASMTTCFQLPAVGKSVVLFTHFSVSENSQQLFGFYDKRERELFRTLIKVSGVGPKLAVAILSGMEADTIARCVVEDNAQALVKIPGIGKKTAERLVVELRDKLKDWAQPAGELNDMIAATPQAQDAKAAISEAESALLALGYKPAEASKAIAGVAKGAENLSAESLIRQALKAMIPA